jgi:DnaJ like chaperone protein
MNATSIAVVLICALVGYWVVSAFFGRKGYLDASPGPIATISTMQPDCFSVLGVLPTASADEIRASYRRLISQYHPDHVASLGQELRDLAERKSKEIVTAYDQAMRGRGEPT